MGSTINTGEGNQDATEDHSNRNEGSGNLAVINDRNDPNEGIGDVAAAIYGINFETNTAASKRGKENDIIRFESLQAGPVASA
jgi:hypothetical protein